MRLMGLELKTNAIADGLACELVHAGGPVARGVWADGAMTGEWVTLNADGQVRTRVDLTEAPFEVELDNNGVYEALQMALLMSFIESNDTPEWFEPAGVLDVAWDEIEDDSRRECAKRFPPLMAAAVSPEPLVRDLVLMDIHLAMVDEGTVFPVTPIAIPRLGFLLEQPGEHVHALALILDNVAGSVLATAEELEIDLAKPSERDALFRPSIRALKALMPHVKNAQANASGETTKALVKLAERITAL
jgi:hypothetical protein